MLKKVFSIAPFSILTVCILGGLIYLSLEFGEVGGGGLWIILASAYGLAALVGCRGGYFQWPKRRIFFWQSIVGVPIIIPTLGMIVPGAHYGEELLIIFPLFCVLVSILLGFWVSWPVGKLLKVSNNTQKG